MSLYLISYDVSSDKRRSRVAKTLESHGLRVQYSVFECELSDRTLERLLARLGDLIDQSTDSVRAYLLCARCRCGAQVVGRGPIVPTERAGVAVV